LLRSLSLTAVRTVLQATAKAHVGQYSGMSLDRQDGWMRGRYWIVKGLDSACGLVDAVVYRPAVVRLTVRIPRWWRCELARSSEHLDDRWGTGYWGEFAAPNGLFDVCQRRAAWLTVGGTDGDEDDDPPDPDHYLAEHPLHTCSWCHVPPSAFPIESAADLAEAITLARARSLGWHWRWRPI